MLAACTSASPTTPEAARASSPAPAPTPALGEVPSEPAVVAALVGFFVHTLVQHQPLSQGA